jgi:hypothetical protein
VVKVAVQHIFHVHGLFAMKPSSQASLPALGAAVRFRAFLLIREAGTFLELMEDFLGSAAFWGRSLRRLELPAP